MAASPVIALIHSPLVGPSAWRRTAAALAHAWDARAIDYGGVSGPDWYGGAARRIAAALPDAAPLALVAHSGGSAFIPPLVDRLGGRVTSIVLVDAVLPYPGRRWLDTAPPALAGRLTELADAGVLPPWDRWFGAGAMEAIVPDADLRAAFSADLPRLPVDYLEAVAPGTDAWRRAPGAYLQLSAACAADADEAERMGWRVRREALHHLAMLTHPQRVAALVAEIIGSELGVGA